MPKVTFRYGGLVKVVEAPEGQTLLQIALNNGVPMEHACGGNGFCTTCMCSVKSPPDSLQPRNDREENMGITMEPYRLGCQARVKADVEVEMEG